MLLHGVAFAEAKDPVITFRAETGQTIKITAVIEANYGISGMNLSLVYDSSAFSFTGYQKGSALSSLDLIATATDGPMGYSIQPFYFNYLSFDNNDYSKGDLLTLSFAVKPNAPDGDYYFSFDYNKDSDVIRLYNNQNQTINPLIDRAKVTLKGNNVDGVTVESADEVQNKADDPNILAIVLPCVFGPIAAVAVTVLLINKKKKRKVYGKKNK